MGNWYYRRPKSIRSRGLSCAPENLSFSKSKSHPHFADPVTRVPTLGPLVGGAFRRDPQSPSFPKMLLLVTSSLLILGWYFFFHKIWCHRLSWPGPRKNAAAVAHSTLLHVFDSQGVWVFLWGLLLGPVFFPPPPVRTDPQALLVFRFAK